MLGWCLAEDPSWSDESGSGSWVATKQNNCNSALHYHCTVKCLAWKGNGLGWSKIFTILWNQKTHYYVHKSSPLDLILSQFNLWFILMNFENYLLRFSDKLWSHLVIPNSCYVSFPHNVLFNYSIWWQYKLWISSL